VRFFKHQDQFWQEKQTFIQSGSHSGHAAWAARQSTMWCSMATQAEAKFAALLKSNPPPELAQVIRPQSTNDMS
jgi:hypothetical protein